MLENEVKNTIRRYKEKIQENLKTDWHVIFKPEMIEIFQKEIPWKEAMYLVSKPLQKNKYISSPQCRGIWRLYRSKQRSSACTCIKRFWSI